MSSRQFTVLILVILLIGTGLAVQNLRLSKQVGIATANANEARAWAQAAGEKVGANPPLDGGSHL